MRGEVAVIGAGHTVFGEHPDKTYPQLFAEAFWEAIESVDKGIDLKEIRAAFIGTLGSGGSQLGNLSCAITGDLNIVPIPAVRVENACASSGFAFMLGVMSVASGLYDVALVGGVEKMRDVAGLRGRYWLGVSGDTLWERLAGATFPGMYALMATKHMERYGTKPEHLAMVAVKNHYYGADNPKAQFRRRIDVETALRSPIVAAPLRLYDCCPTSDGATAVIMCKSDIAKRYTDLPVYVLGLGAATDYIAVYERDDITTLRATVEASRQAYKVAGIEPKDIDLAEVHDCFTIAEIIAYEDLGFCEKGEGWKLIEERQTYVGGKIPVNVSGGLKAKGHPIGATGTSQVYEVFKQLRNEAKERSRQVPGAEIGLTHNVGGSGGTCVVHIFGVRR